MLSLARMRARDACMSHIWIYLQGRQFEPLHIDDSVACPPCIAAHKMSSCLTLDSSISYCYQSQKRGMLQWKEQSIGCGLPSTSATQATGSTWLKQVEEARSRRILSLSHLLRNRTVLCVRLGPFIVGLLREQPSSLSAHRSSSTNHVLTSSILPLLLPFSPISGC